jgi:hypothetical protein
MTESCSRGKAGQDGEEQTKAGTCPQMPEAAPARDSHTQGVDSILVISVLLMHPPGCHLHGPPATLVIRARKTSYLCCSLPTHCWATAQAFSSFYTRECTDIGDKQHAHRLWCFPEGQRKVLPHRWWVVAPLTPSFPPAFIERQDPKAS